MARSEEARLIVALEARINQFEKAFDRSQRVATRGYAQITNGSSRMAARIDADFSRAARSVDQFSSVAGRLKGLIAVALGGAGVASAIGVIRDMEKLRSSLETVTGSAGGAAKAFDLITKLAAKTPFSVQEVTQAFIKLKSLGLDPSEAAITSYGNTAAAMGKSLDQMIEAVADAATGEFERLKEFGIRAKSEGDKVSFTFQNITKTVGKNATEIEAYLRSIGDTNFAGAMDRQAKTLDGALSNLADSTTALIDKMGQAGLGKAIADLAREMSDAATDSEGLATTLGEVLGVAVDELTRRLRLLNETAGDFRRSGLIDGLNSLGKSILEADPALRALGSQLDAAGPNGSLSIEDARRRAREISAERDALTAERERLSRSAADPMAAQQIARLDARLRQLEVTERELGLRLRADPFRGPVPAAPTSALPVSTPTEVTVTADKLSGLADTLSAAPTSALPVSTPTEVTVTADKLSGLADTFEVALRQMIADARAAGHEISVSSGLRTRAQQQALWEEAIRKYGSPAAARKWVAPPGSSRHESGMAADLRFGGAGAQAWAHQNAGAYGLNFPMGWEPWHVEPGGARGGVAATSREAATALQESSAAARQQAEAYYEAVDAAKKLAEAQQEAATKTAEAYTSIAKDAVGGLISDLRNGVSAADAMANALDRVADRLIDMALDAVFSPSAFAGLFGGGGAPLNLLPKAGGGPVRRGGAYLVGERRPELFIPNTAGTIVPNPRAMPAGGGRGGGGDVVLNITNTTGQPVEKTGERMTDLGKMIDLRVGDAIQSGRLDKPMAGRFGARPVTTRRGK